MLNFPHPPSVSLALVIDLEALAHNYRTLRNQAKKGTLCGAALKANAYGMGTKEAALRLLQEGCRHFFVAHLSEAIELQCFVGRDVSIFVLNGLRAGEEEVYAHYHLIPVLSDFEQVQRWNTFSKTKKACLRAALHFDTGMTRTGISLRETNELSLSDLSHTEIVCIMSHLACSYQAKHPMNEAQRLSFDVLQKRFPFALASLSGSGGTFLSPEYHYNLLRVGYALTGCRSTVIRGNYTLKPAIKAYAQVLQINDVLPGRSIGYDATFLTSRASRIATLGVGYADGYFRSLSNCGEVYFKGHKLPVVGKVSMDLTTVDITHVPPNKICVGDWVELFGENMGADKVAEKAGTISLELFTHLGPRFERFYVKALQIQEVA